MARKNEFSETVKFIKKAMKDRIFVQFKEGAAYICDGHTVIKMPGSYYNTFIIPSVPGIPYFTGEDSKSEVSNGQIKEGNVDPAKFISDFKFYEGIETKASNILFECDRNMTARAFIWDDPAGATTGCLINDTFCKVAREFSNGKYLCTSKNAPVITSRMDGELIFLMLPIYPRPESEFAEYLDALNAAKAARKAA